MIIILLLFTFLFVGRVLGNPTLHLSRLPELLVKNKTAHADTHLPPLNQTFNPPWLTSLYNVTDPGFNWTRPHNFDDTKAPDCIWAGKYWPFSSMGCTSHWDRGADHLHYRIIMSGTGQVQLGWCDGIYGNIKRECPMSTVRRGACLTANADTINHALNGDEGWSPVALFGIDMDFIMYWPWETEDANHHCVARAVRRATCSSVDIYTGVACRSDEFDGEVLEYDTNMGGAY